MEKIKTAAVETVRITASVRIKGVVKKSRGLAAFGSASLTLCGAGLVLVLKW